MNTVRMHCSVWQRVNIANFRSTCRRCSCVGSARASSGWRAGVTLCRCLVVPSYGCSAVALIEHVFSQANAVKRRQRALYTPFDTNQSVHFLSFTVPTFSTQLAAGVAREQAMGEHLRQKRERASILSVAAARAFREGRDRLKMTHALATLRNFARARRFSTIATARISSLRRSRCIRMWNERVQHVEHHRALAATALVFAAGASKRAISQGARAALRTWAARMARRRRRQHGAAAVGEKLHGTRLRVAVHAWRELSRVHAISAATERRRALHLAYWNARRALGRWRLASFGDTRAATSGGGGGRVLARLFAVAARCDDAALRRRARALLQNWVGRVEKRKRLKVAKM